MKEPMTKKNKLTIGSLIILLILFALVAILPPEALESLMIWLLIFGG